MRATEDVREAGIAAALPGNRVADVSAAIGEVADARGYPVNTRFGGHGFGRTMHEVPHVPTRHARGRGLTPRPGMTLAPEPWWTRTTDDVVVDDGWTIRSADGSRTAHSEHSVAVTEQGPQVLTALTDRVTGAVDERA